jgi:hypothetical protein
VILCLSKKGLYADEEGAIYKVLEINQDRVLLEFVNTNMPIRPQSIANISEIEVIDQHLFSSDKET